MLKDPIDRKQLINELILLTCVYDRVVWMDKIH